MIGKGGDPGGMCSAAPPKGAFLSLYLPAMGRVTQTPWDAAAHGPATLVLKIACRSISFELKNDKTTQTPVHPLSGQSPGKEKTRNEVGQGHGRSIMINFSCI